MIFCNARRPCYNTPSEFFECLLPRGHVEAHYDAIRSFSWPVDAAYPTTGVGSSVIVVKTQPAVSVDHPAHYGGADNVYEVIKVIDAWDLGFSRGNVLKYVARAGKKNGVSDVEDLQKARRYLDFEISRRTQQLR